jgi:signal transduction histidine kinase/CheY-like chemotaxis protein
LFLVSIGIFIVSFRNDVMVGVQIIAFALGLSIMAGLAWYLDGVRPLVGRWFTVITLAAILYISQLWLDTPLTLMLAFLSVGLAAALISLPASAVVAAGQTIIIFYIYRVGGGISPSFLTFVMISIWCVFWLMVAVYTPVLNVARWSWDYFNSAKLLLEEARNRKAELEQALEDLANANQQLIRLNKLAQDLRLVAENARAAKEQFVANVSHELRTPLNMIIGFTEMILNAPPRTYGSRLPGALLADLTVIYRNADHLSHLINDVLDLSQIEADQMALTKELIHFTEIVEFATAAVQPLFKLKGLYLEGEIAEDLPEVFCDRTRMREVLLNLLSNAGRFTERGGVRVRAWQEGNTLLVAVSDTGPGIAEEDIDRLFHPFEQLDSSIRRRYGGTGLGLAISKRFIEMHEGQIWVQSEQGKGTTFTFRIPLSIPGISAGNYSRWFNPLIPFEERTHIPKLPKADTRPRFLVLESGDILQRLLGRYLGEVEIIPVADLEVARQELLRSPAQALLVNKPSLTSALESLDSADFLVEGTPAIICSLPGMEEASTTLDVQDILVKPISRAMLLDTLARLNILQGTVLIVDDEPDALQLFGRMLSTGKSKYHIRLARDGQEALDIIHESRPDVILLDLVMPDMNGYQFLEARSQDPELQNIPIVVISARDPGEHPVVSHGLVIARQGGFSVRQILTCIQVISRILSVSGPSGGQEPPEGPPG